MHSIVIRYYYEEQSFISTTLIYRQFYFFIFFSSTRSNGFSLVRFMEISRMCPSDRELIFIQGASDRSPISNAVYEFCSVTSRVLDKNRLLGPARSEGISMGARIARASLHVTLELVPRIMHDRTNCFQIANRRIGAVLSRHLSNAVENSFLRFVTK